MVELIPARKRGKKRNRMVKHTPPHGLAITKVAERKGSWLE